MNNMDTMDLSLPERICGVCCFISFLKEVDVRERFIHLAHEGKDETQRRAALVALAKMDWVEAHLDAEDYQIEVFKTPIRELGAYNVDWYADLRKAGCQPDELYYQVCISFTKEADCDYYQNSIGEIY